MPKNIRNSILSILILGMILFSTLGLLSESATLRFLEVFSDNPKISMLVNAFQANVWYYVLFFGLGIALCFCKVDTQVKSYEKNHPHLISVTIKLLLVSIFLGGFIVRLNLLFEPITYDEAFTYNQYASQPWSTVLSSYTYPNNQIFHTILAKLSTGVFGISHWALRLPSFLFSLATILLAFRIGRFTNVKLGLMLAFILAFAPIFIDYGALARGYSIVLFLGMLLWKFSIAWQQKDRVDAFSQIRFILTAAFAIWTIPVAILPIGIVLVKMRKTFNTNLIIKLGLGLGLVAVTLYSPVILLFGWTELVTYPSMPQASYAMLLSHHLFHGFEHIYYVFIMQKEVLLLIILLAIYAMIKKPNIAKEYAQLGLMILLFLLITRVDPPARVWLVIMPFVYFPMLRYYSNQDLQQKSNLLVTAFILVISSTAILTLQSGQFSVMRDFRMTAEKDAVKWMRDNQPSSSLESAFPSNAGIRWYQFVYDLPNQNKGVFQYSFHLKNDNSTFTGEVIKETSEYFILENTDNESIKN